MGVFEIPVYEFKCVKCGHVSEKMLPIKSKMNSIPCEKCGYISRKIISNTNFMLKGSGWARSGYCKK